MPTESQNCIALSEMLSDSNMSIHIEVVGYTTSRREHWAVEERTVLNSGSAPPGKGDVLTVLAQSLSDV